MWGDYNSLCSLIVCEEDVRPAGRDECLLEVQRELADLVVLHAPDFWLVACQQRVKMKCRICLPTWKFRDRQCEGGGRR